MGVIGAYLIRMMGWVITEGLVHSLYGPMPRVGYRVHPTVLSLLTIVAIAIFLNLICGYLAVLWSGSQKMAPAVGLAGLTFWTDFLIFTSWSIISYPGWYLPMRLLTCTFCLIGGYLRIQTHKLKIEAQVDGHPVAPIAPPFDH